MNLTVLAQIAVDIYVNTLSCLFDVSYWKVLRCSWLIWLLDFCCPCFIEGNLDLFLSLASSLVVKFSCKLPVLGLVKERIFFAYKDFAP